MAIDQQYRERHTELTQRQQYNPKQHSSTPTSHSNSNSTPKPNPSKSNPQKSRAPVQTTSSLGQSLGNNGRLKSTKC
jgi:hypothetical protein